MHTWTKTRCSLLPALDGNVSQFQHVISPERDPNLILSVNWTLRDGTSFEAIPAGWDVNLTCGWSNGPWKVRERSRKRHSTCVYPMAPVALGSKRRG